MLYIIIGKTSNQLKRTMEKSKFNASKEANRVANLVTDNLEELQKVKDGLVSCLVSIINGDIKDKEVSDVCAKKLADGYAMLDNLITQVNDFKIQVFELKFNISEKNSVPKMLNLRDFDEILW